MVHLRARGTVLATVCLFVFLAAIDHTPADAFVSPPLPRISTASACASNRQPQWILSEIRKTTTILAATEGSKKSKRKRRRKKPPAAPAEDPVKVSQEKVEGLVREEVDDDDDDEPEMLTKEDMAVIGDVAKFEFQMDKEIAMGVIDDDTKAASDSSSSMSNTIPLPDIKEARKKKQMEEELARQEKEKEEQKVRIKRSDKEAFARVRSFNWLV